MNKVEFYPIIYENNKLYVHIRKEPNEKNIYKKYFGITKLKIWHRWGESGKGYSRKNKNGKHTYFYNAISKYGWDEGFRHIVIFENITRKVAEELEKFFIAYYHTDNNKYGYNETKGGEGAIPNENLRKKMSESRKGEKHWNYGNHWSKETRQKISETRIKRGVAKGEKNPNYGKGISGEANRNFGTHLSEETKQKISRARVKNGVAKGEKNPFFGKHHTKETKNKLSDIRSIAVIRLSDNKIYKNSIICAEDNNISSCAVKNHCKNKVANPKFAYYKID